jgi:uncharacterized protein
MDTVFWMDLHAGPGRSLEGKFRQLLQRAGVQGLAGKGELVAIKVHAGERGNLGYVSHNYSRLAAESVLANGGRPFLTDTNTLYSGGRHNAVDHLVTAEMHGFLRATTGAPFIVADGLRGLGFEELPLAGGKHVRAARIASGVSRADKLFMLSHFKGHCEMGFGGTIKNMGMGCAAAPGKLECHSGTQPLQDHDKCVACGQCVMNCPEQAISLDTGKAVIDGSACIGCGQCVAACVYGAMQVDWSEHGACLLEKVVEYAAAVYRRFSGKALYVNFAFSISPDCDCWDYNDAPVIRDIGILASRSPAALDRATLDMVIEAPRLTEEGPFAKQGVNPFDAMRPGLSTGYLFEYARKFGMDDAYSLEKVE